MCGSAAAALAFTRGRYESSINRGPGLGDELPTARRPPNGASSFPDKTLIAKPFSSANFFASSAIHFGFLIFDGV